MSTHESRGANESSSGRLWSIHDGVYNPATPVSAEEVFFIKNSTHNHGEETKTRLQVLFIFNYAMRLSDISPATNPTVQTDLREYLADATEYCRMQFGDHYVAMEDSLRELAHGLEDERPPISRAIHDILAAGELQALEAQKRAQALDAQEAKEQVGPVEMVDFKGDTRRYLRAIERIRFLEEQGMSRDTITAFLREAARQQAETSEEKTA